MGTVTFSISRFGGTNPNVRGPYINGGAHTTSTTASNLSDGAAGAGTEIQAIRGHVLTGRTDEDGRVVFGGTATATSGHIVFAGETFDLEVTADGPISFIDVA